MYFGSLKLFCDVVRFHSFSQAAAANQITQSAVSQNVHQLEKGLGVRLIDRSKRPFQLTPEGRAYFEGCRDVLERYDLVEDQVKALSREVAGKVAVAAIYSIGLSDMSGYIQEFARKYPRATVRLAYLNPDRVYDSVLNEDADIGLVAFPRARRGLTVLNWRTEPMVVACPPSHRLATQPHVRPEDLAGEQIVAFDSGLTARREVDRFLRKHRVEVRVGMAFDNTETIKHAVEVGEGLAILPEPTLRKEVRAGTLVAVPLAPPGLTRPLAILHRRAGLLSPTAREFLEMIRPDAPDPTHPTDTRDADEPTRSGDSNAVDARTSRMGVIS